MYRDGLIHAELGIQLTLPKKKERDRFKSPVTLLCTVG